MSLNIAKVVAAPFAEEQFENPGSVPELLVWRDIGLSACTRAEAVEETVSFSVGIPDHFHQSSRRFDGDGEGGILAQLQVSESGAVAIIKESTEKRRGKETRRREELRVQQSAEGNVLVAAIVEKGRRTWGTPITFCSEVVATRMSPGSDVLPAAFYILTNVLRPNGCIGIPSWNGEPKGVLWAFTRDSIYRIEGFEQGQQLRGVKLLEQLRGLRPLVAAVAVA
jgi:hypothetical protein